MLGYQPCCSVWVLWVLLECQHFLCPALGVLAGCISPEVSEEPDGDGRPDTAGLAITPAAFITLPLSCQCTRDLPGAGSWLFGVGWGSHPPCTPQQGYILLHTAFPMWHSSWHVPLAVR